MASDPPTLNALKAIEKSLQDQNRTLKSVDSHLAKIAGALAALNTNYVDVHRTEESASE